MRHWTSVILLSLSPSSHTPGSQVCTFTSSFSHDAGDLNLGPISTIFLTNHPGTHFSGNGIPDTGDYCGAWDFSHKLPGDASDAGPGILRANNESTFWILEIEALWYSKISMFKCFLWCYAYFTVSVSIFTLSNVRLYFTNFKIYFVNCRLYISNVIGVKIFLIDFLTSVLLNISLISLPLYLWHPGYKTSLHR